MLDMPDYAGPERREQHDLHMDGNTLLAILVLVIGWLCGGTWYMAAEYARVSGVETVAASNVRAIDELRKTNDTVNDRITEILERMATLSQKVESVHEDVVDIKTNMHREGR